MESTIFSEWLQRTRAIKGLTLKELSEKSGLDVGTLYGWESGRTKSPTPKKIRKLAAAFEVDPGVIFTAIADSKKLDKVEVSG